MKRFVKKVALFVVLMPIVILVLIVSWGMVMPSVIHDNILFLRGSNSFLYQRVREAEQYKNSDVLVLGASHAYREIDPTIFKNKGYKLFNLGSSSQTPLQTRILLNRYLSTLNPHVILYEVYPEVFCMDGVESALDLISNDRVELDFLTMSLAIHDIKPYLSLIYSYFRQVFALDAHKSIPDTLSGDMYVSGGFVRKKMEMFNPPDKFTLVSWEINQIQWDVFHQILDHLMKQGKEVVLFQSPVTEFERNRVTNYSEFDSILESTHLPYFNFNRGIQWPDEYFYDSNHLNQAGVEVFNAMFIDTLETHQLLK